MLNQFDAFKLVSKKLEEYQPVDDPYVVIFEKTTERPFGWIFFYDSKKYLETGNQSLRLAGNGPVSVNKKTGSVDFFGSDQPIEILLKYHEAGLK